MRRFLIGLGIAACLALGYVQQRVTLVHMGYEVEGLRRLKDDLLDQHRVLQYNVLTLRSPVILSQRLARADVKLTPPQHVEILSSQTQRVVTASPTQTSVQALPSWVQRAREFATRWLEGGRQAVAEPAQEGR